MSELVVPLVILLAVMGTLDVFVWRFVYHRARARRAPSTAPWMDTWRQIEKLNDQIEANLMVAIFNLVVAACALIVALVVRLVR